MPKWSCEIYGNKMNSGKYTLYITNHTPVTHTPPVEPLSFYPQSNSFYLTLANDPPQGRDRAVPNAPQVCTVGVCDGGVCVGHACVRVCVQLNPTVIFPKRESLQKYRAL